MKKRQIISTVLAVTLCAITQAQAGAGMGRMGGMGGMAAMGGGSAKGPDWSGKMAQLFSDTPNFSASVEMQTKGASARDSMTMPGEISFSNGKSRFELDLLKNSQIPAEATAQMKNMGMDKTVMISRPDKDVAYMIYPGLKAYVENPVGETGGTKQDDFKMDVTELAKETVDGRPTIKTKVVLTDKEGKKHESLMWRATDMKKFPVKIEQSESGTTVTMLFKNVKFDKPADSLFEVPGGYKKYDNMMALMQQEMMKRMGGGLPPGHP